MWTECLCIWFCYVTVCESILCSVFGCEIFVWKALRRLDSCTHHPATTLSSLLIKKNILHMTQLQTKKMWFQNRLLAGGSDHFGQEKSFYVDSFPSFLSCDTCTSFVYIFFHSDFSSPAMKFLATLATLAPTVSWLRKVILTQLCKNLYKAERQWLSLSVWRKS